MNTMKLIFLIFLSGVTLGSFSQNLKMFTKSCALSDSPIDCNELSYTLASYVDFGDEFENDFSFEISTNLENDDPFVIAYKYSITNSSAPTKTVTKHFSKDSNVSNDFLMTSLVNQILKSIEDITGVTPKKANSNIVFTPEGAGFFFKNANSRSLSLNLGSDLNLYKKDSRFDVDLDYSYSNNVSPKTANFEGSNVSERRTNVSVDIVHSLEKENFSIRVGAAHTQVNFDHSFTLFLPEEVLQNIANSSYINLGIEWSQKPFLTEEAGNISIQLSYSPQNHRYIDPHTFKDVDETYHPVSSSFGYSRFFKGNTSIKIALSAYSDLRKESKYRGTGIHIQPQVVIFKKLALQPTFSMSYNDGAILSPTQGSSFINLTGQTSEAQFNYFGNFRVTYTFGNISKKNQDQRWK